ncbi:MAG: hypothetical protein J7599_06950 [Niabella sp.]|nr:hypothetical protein [Niabella sp.]
MQFYFFLRDEYLLKRRYSTIFSLGHKTITGCVGRQGIRYKNSRILTVKKCGSLLINALHHFTFGPAPVIIREKGKFSANKTGFRWLFQSSYSTKLTAASKKQDIQPDATVGIMVDKLKTCYAVILLPHSNIAFPVA